MAKVDKHGRQHNEAGHYVGNGSNGTATGGEGINLSPEQFSVVANAFTSMSRAAMSRGHGSDNFDNRKNIPAECGWPDTQSVTIGDYRDLYDREPMANRVCELEPRESWRTQPKLNETSDADETTEFEAAWDTLGTSLLGGSKYQDEEGSPIWGELMRADIASGIGSFGVLLLGLDDGKELFEPAEKATALMFLRSFDQSSVTIVEVEKDKSSVRFGLPTDYDIRMAGVNDLNSGNAGATETTRVHWTRVIHLADNRLSSPVIGTPRMQPVLNPLLDIRKVRGGSAEMYWKGAFMGLSWETHPNLDITAPDATATKRVMEDFINGLQRYIAISGGHMNSLAPQVVDPSPQIQVQIDAICIQKACPKRVFMGSERGELSSEQDERGWNGRMESRRTHYVTPFVIVPFVDRLIRLGVLPEPDGYSVEWEPLTVMTPEQRAAIALSQTDAMTKYVAGASSLITEADWLVEVLGMDQDRANAIVKAAAEAFDDDEPPEPEIGEQDEEFTESLIPEAGQVGDTE